ncbi:hypothetical protein PENTCL1PPCAC_9065, partial [Pristionchus entomophagus]
AGCTLSNGTIVPFHKYWQVGTEMHRCVYTMKDKITASVALYGCAYNSRAILYKKIVEDGSELKKCAKVGEVYTMRDLTAEEREAYMKWKKVGGHKTVIGGEGGFGSGSELTAGQSDET